MGLRFEKVKRKTLKCGCVIEKTYLGNIKLATEVVRFCPKDTPKFISTKRHLLPVTTMVLGDWADDYLDKRA